MQVRHTKNYDEFKYLESNRNIDSKHVNKLIDSISEADMTHANPVLVTPDMEVIDGQHRIEALKRLGKGVYYIVLDETPYNEFHSVKLLNTTTANWRPIDYVNSYANQGNEHYQALKEFIELYNISVTPAALLLGGSVKAPTKAVKEGTFKVAEKELAYNIAKWINPYREICKYPSLAQTKTFLYALMRLSKDHPEVSHREIIEKAKKNGIEIGVEALARNYLQELENIYNMHKKYKVRFY